MGSKYYEDSHASCIMHTFEIEDNPQIEMIRITTVDTNCDNMYDMDFEFDYFFDYQNRDLMIEYLSSEGYYNGDLYEAIKNKYGEYLERGLPYFTDMMEYGITYLRHCFFHAPSVSMYSDFVNLKSREEFMEKYDKYKR